MSTTIRITATRGTTAYEFTAHQNLPDATRGVEYILVEKDAENFERWLNRQPERQALNDTQSRSTR